MIQSVRTRKMKKWLITGGCGFIGLSLIKSLLKQGNNYIRVIDNLKVGSISDLEEVCSFYEVAVDKIISSELSVLIDEKKKVEFVEGDILDRNLAKKVVLGFDYVVHLAANTGVAPSVIDPRMDLEVNVIGTFNYLEAAKASNVERFIFASSGAPVGEVTPPIHEETVPHPVSPYGSSKLACEGYCSSFFRTYGLDTVCLRFSNVYGPLSINKESLIAKFIKQAINGDTLEIYGDGKQTRDFIFIEDLVQAIQLAATTPLIGGEIFQIATSKETTLDEVVKHLLPLLTAYGIKDHNITFSKTRRGDVLRNFSDTSKAQNVLGWRNRVSLAEGLDETVKWYSENYKKATSLTK